VREDQDEALDLYKALKSIPKVKPWIDKEDLLPGEHWPSTIKKTIRESEFFISLLSKNSVDKKGVFRAELKQALDIYRKIPKDKVFLIPIRLEKCSLPIKKLKSIQYVDLFPTKDKGMKKVLRVVNRPYEYLGRIDRAKYIIESVESFIKEIKKNKKVIEIRIRATFTSMSNISHYFGKKIPGLFIQQGREYDRLLKEERDIILKMLNLEHVKLKCICWPKMRFLSSDYYNDQEKRKRVNLLKSFLRNSLEKYLDSRQILCDEAGAYGNQLIIGNQLAIVANPESGGYTKTSTFKDQQTIDVLIKEYDILFRRIQKRKKKIGNFNTVKLRNKNMLLNTMNTLDSEFEMWKNKVKKSKLKK